MLNDAGFALGTCRAARPWDTSTCFTIFADGTFFMFKICLNTSTLRGYKLPLRDLIDIAARAQFDAIEPWIPTSKRTRHLALH
jgi:hypothetical protein